MKTALTKKELPELSDKELLDTLEYAILKYNGRNVNYEISNLKYEIEDRMKRKREGSNGD